MEYPMHTKKKACLLMLLLAAALLCGCKQNPAQEQLYAKLFKHFEDRGYACELLTLTDTAATVAIADVADWKRLLVGQEEVFVYFDESNRADYLSSMIDASEFGTVAHFGLRFVLTYAGADEGVQEALQDME